MKKYKTEYFITVYWTDWDGEKFKLFKDYINSLDVPEEATLNHDYDSTGVSIEIRREETDKEYEARLLDESEKTNRYLREKEESDKKEYERLKAKYENR